MKTNSKKLSFKQISKIIIDKCIEKNACKPEFDKLTAAKTEKEFWEVIKANGYWAHENGVISVELFEQYDSKKLNENLIFIDGGNRELPANCIAINYNGTVSKNNGTVSYNNGTVSKNGNDGTVGYNNGTVSKNNGTVSYNNGTVSENDGTVSYNNGTVSKNNRTVSYNNRTVSKNGNHGTVGYNNGTVSKNNGTVSYNNGTVSENDGTVSENNGMVSENHGMAVVIERNKKKIYIKKGEFEIVYFD